VEEVLDAERRRLVVALVIVVLDDVISSHVIGFGSVERIGSVDASAESAAAPVSETRTADRARLHAGDLDRSTDRTDLRRHAPSPIRLLLVVTSIASTGPWRATLPAKSSTSVFSFDGWRRKPRPTIWT
jgi:hypothetical protein